MSISYTNEQSTNTYSPHTNGQVGAPVQQSMDGRPAEYAQPGSRLPYPRHHPETPSEPAPADQASGAQYPQGQDTKFNPSATPTSEYGMTPSSARQAQFPNEYAQRTPQYADHRYQNPGGQPPNMAHASSPSPYPNNASTSDQPPSSNGNSNQHLPIDPNIAAASPTYHQAPPHYAQQGHPDLGYYQSPIYHRPGDYPPPGYPPYQGHYPPPMMGGRPGPPGGGVPLSTVYSFVPIPGTHQQKRPRRRYEEIERMYKCGWNGCEKAYGTLNHLNAHVTMQAHGVKRTPEEFKEIRKEWKQRKKEEDTQRKQDDDRRGGGPHVDGQSAGSDSAQSSAGSYPQGARQLPPLGYAPAGAQVQAQYPAQPVDGMAQQYSGPPVQSYYSPSQYPGSQHAMYTTGHPPPNGQEHGVANST